MADKIPCSVPILTLNCAENLRQCLESVKDFCDIVVLDGNSTDGTQDEARAYGARVYPQFDTLEPNQRITDFNAMRTKALGHTKENWILWIDSDEFLGSGAADEIRHIVEVGDPTTAYKIPRIAIINNRVIRHAFFYPDAVVRLYHKASGIYPKPNKKVHETDFIPAAVTQKTMSEAIYTHWSSYRDFLKRDEYYFGIFRAEWAKDRLRRTRYRILRKGILNIMKAAYIGYKTTAIYARYGFRDTLPPQHAWRFMRYHLRIAGTVLASVFG
ncbi:MAG: glycosyltransferase family 2 protein [Patescibacteria group bacterium]